LKAPLLGALALLGSLAPGARSAAEQERGPAEPTRDSEELSSHEVERVARVFFDYDVPKTDADAIARSAGSSIKIWRSIARRHILPIDPPFDFSLVRAQAERLAKKS